MKIKISRMNKLWKSCPQPITWETWIKHCEENCISSWMFSDQLWKYFKSQVILGKAKL